jgi:SNF2 family DNA or RNA helicase
MESKGCAFLMDMGTGKTITTIAVAGAMYQTGRVKKLLVVSPKSIVQVWQQEFDKFADFPYSVAVLDGDGGKKADTIRHMASFGLAVIVVNYESCWRLEADLMRWKPDMIVCDESSKIKNPQAKCSKALHRLGKQSSYNLILTGTPITNSPLDFFSQYKFLDESIFGGSFYGFRSKYAILGGYQNHQIVGYKHLAELVQLAHGVAFRIRIDEAVELPEFVEEIRPVKLERKAQQIYDGIDKDSFAELMSGEVTARNVLTRLLRLSQCTGGFIRDDEGGVVQEVSRAKLEALEDIVDERMEQGKKVVVFARFVPEIDSIAKLLQKKKILLLVILSKSVISKLMICDEKQV